MRNPRLPGSASLAQTLPPRWSGHAGSIAAMAGLAFIGLVLALQWLRSDLCWVDAN